MKKQRKRSKTAGFSINLRMLEELFAFLETVVLRWIVLHRWISNN
jgi:hypothetical protein